DDEGAGAPLVLIHGHPFDRSMWRPQVSEFSGSGWRVIAPDLRGYGENSVTPGTMAWKTFDHRAARRGRTRPSHDAPDISRRCGGGATEPC
ncbi:MAG: alpha/beta fold hydrolase, partial [Pseudonocardiaceae bacterium]